MSGGYVDVLKSYDAQRHQQIVDLNCAQGGAAGDDLGTEAGRIRLRETLHLAPDPYLVEVPGPGASGGGGVDKNDVCPLLRSQLVCPNIQTLVSEHVRGCQNGCNCDNTVERDAGEDGWEYATSRRPERDAQQQRTTTERSYGRPDIAMLFDP